MISRDVSGVAFLYKNYCSSRPPRGRCAGHTPARSRRLCAHACPLGGCVLGRPRRSEISGVELVVVAVHRRGSLQRLEPHTALLAHKVHAGAHADLVRRQLRESQALAAVPAGALLLDPIDEPRGRSTSIV